MLSPIIDQTHFAFDPIEGNSKDYFVLHSGVMESYRRGLSILVAPNFLGNLFYVYGAKGCGKSHFIKVLVNKCEELNIVSKYFKIDSGKIRDEEGMEVDPSSFISIYQEIKSRHGLMLVEANRHANEECEFSEVIKPHILSRLLSGEIFNLLNPEEEELRPILIALLERHHLRLKDSQLDLILSRVPAIPDYFRVISEALTELAPRVGKLKVGILRDYLESQV